MILWVARGTEYADAKTLQGRLHVDHSGTTSLRALSRGFAAWHANIQ